MNGGRVKSDYGLALPCFFWRAACHGTDSNLPLFAYISGNIILVFEKYLIKRTLLVYNKKRAVCKIRAEAGVSI